MADDYFYYAFKEGIEVTYADEKGDEKGDEKEDSKEEKNEDKYNDSRHLNISYTLLFNFQYFSTLEKIHQIALLYETRCRELESPPPEV